MVEKKRDILDILVIAAFAGFLFLLAAVGIFSDRETYSYYENRNLAPVPELTQEELLSGGYFKSLDAYLADQAPARNILLKADTFVDLRLLRRPVVNDVVVRDRLLLPFLDYDMFSLRDIPGRVEAMVENLTSVRDAAESVGAAFYYVAVPCQYAYFEDEYPWYLNNNAAYTQASRAALRDALEEAGVGYLDIGDTFAALGSPDSLGSAVDNHYPLYAGFLAYRAILERVNRDTGLDIPVLGEADVTFTPLPNVYLGSRNRKLMGLWTNDEKLTTLAPKTEVPFRRWDWGVEHDASVYTLPASPGEDVTYSLYMGGDMSETVIDTDRDHLPSVLIYGDSFTNAVECVLYLSFDETRSLDLRHYTDMTLGEYIREYEPDLVICVRDYEALLSADYNGAGANG